MSLKRTFFTADTHIGHENILKYTKRFETFSTIEEHDNMLISNWNSVVGKKDEVYHLGDVAFGDDDYVEYVLNQLNGTIYFIPGNHDKVCYHPKVAKRFEWTKKYHELSYKYKGINNKIILFHFPIQEWNGKFHGSMHAHGHSHNNIFPIGRRMDIGVDNPILNYTPIFIESFIDNMLKIDLESELYTGPNDPILRSIHYFNNLSEKNKIKVYHKIKEMIECKKKI